MPNQIPCIHFAGQLKTCTGGKLPSMRNLPHVLVVLAIGVVISLFETTLTWA